MMTVILLLPIFIGSSFGFDVDLKDFLKKLNKDCPVADDDDDSTCPGELTFWLYTRENRDGAQLVIDSMHSAPFVDAQLKILVHGYWNDKDSEMNRVLRDSYFNYGEYNIISVDWGAFVKKKCYYQGVVSIPVIGRCVGEFVNAVRRVRDFGIVHLLGHSLGAHVSARASQTIDPPLQRLTRFDPALPLFVDATTRKGTANFRDVYHSNIGVLAQSAPEGDVDVYFNNGAFQPGCECSLQCSHMRGVQYFAESIARDMKGFYCSSWLHFIEGKCPMPRAEDLVELGDRADQSKRGSFTVFTRDKEPFLYDSDVYLDPEQFDEFKDSARSECDATDIYDLVKHQLS